MTKSAFILASALCLSACASAPTITKSGLDPQNFIDEYEGVPVALYTLTNKSGMEVCVTNFGGRVVSLCVPDRDGNSRDVVLGFDKVSNYYPEVKKSSFGAAIGRYANRICGGHLEIDGVEYELPLNSNGHCIHGGTTGWQYRPYQVVEADDSHLTLKMDSPDGDNNFPGAVEAFVTYTVGDDNSLKISYKATTDKPTVINMTNHSFFNLAGDPAGHNVADDYLWLNSTSFTPVDSTIRTLGLILPVEGTPLDFSSEKKVGLGIDDKDYDQIRYAGGYDHNWVLDTNRDLTVKAARVYCPESGIVMEVYTDEPGLQVYTANSLDGSAIGKGGVAYNSRSAICLESQKYPDTPNNPEWPSAIVRPGETYTSTCIYAFSTAE